MALEASTIVLIVRISIFTAYLLAGAAVFQVLEKENYETELRQTTERREEIVKKYNISRADMTRWAQTFLSNPLVEDISLEWNYGNSFVFAMVTVTTIGYGNIVPTTFGGRLFCIFYALLGIPGTCLTLKSIGDKISETICALTVIIERRLLKRPRPRNLQLKTTIITIVVTCIVLPLLSAIVYAREKEWTYFHCFYFTFTTLTTIGYGDFLPHFENSLDFLLIVVAFLGLAFVSSILCSLNNVMDTFGLSARIVKSVKDSGRVGDCSSGDDGQEDDKLTDNVNSEHLTTDEIVREETRNDKNANNKKKRHETGDEEDETASELKCFGKNGSYDRQGKRQSVSVGVFTV